MTRIVKKSAERRAEIIDCAKRLFIRKPYDKASMQDIMEELNIAKGTIYHYFTSKDALFEAVVERIAEENINTLKKLIAKPGNALEKMKRLIQTANIAQENKEIVQALHSPKNATIHIRLLAAVILNQAPLYAEVISQGCQEGIFSTEDPLESAEFILSAVQFLTDRGLYSWKNADLQRRIDALPRLIEKQLQAPQGSFQFLVQLINNSP